MDGEPLGITEKNSHEDNVIIGEGDLAGKGVYANKDFEPDEVVIKYHLRPLTQEEFDALPEDEQEFTHSQRGIMYLYSVPERYVNHSNNPNTYQDYVNKADVALLHISKGDMITTDATKDDVS